MAMKYKYRERSAEALDKRANRQGGNFKGFIKDDYKTWRPVAGDNRVRFLPPTWDDPEHFGIDVYAHYRVGPDDATVLCLAKMQTADEGGFKSKKLGNRCPVCEAYRKAEKSGDEDLAKELRPRSSVIAWIVDLKDKSKGPLVWTMSYTIDRDIAKICKDPQDGSILAIDHPLDGYGVSFSRIGDRLNTKYSGFMTDRKPSSIEQAWLDFVVENPLDQTLVWRTYAEVVELFEGADDADTKEDDDDVKVRREDDDRSDEEANRGQSRRARDDDDENPKRSTRDDENPKRSTRDEEDARPSRRAKDDDDDRPSRRARDDDEDEKPKSRRARDEEDEAEKPKRSARNDDDDDKPAKKAPRDEDEEEKPRFTPKGKAAKPRDDDEEDVKPAKKPARDDDDEPASGASRAAGLRERMAARRGG